MINRRSRNIINEDVKSVIAEYGVQHRPGHPSMESGGSSEFAAAVYPAFKQLHEALAQAFAKDGLNTAANKADGVMEGALAALEHVYPQLKLQTGGKTFTSKISLLAKLAQTNNVPETDEEPL